MDVNVYLAKVSSLAVRFASSDESVSAAAFNEMVREDPIFIDAVMEVYTYIKTH